MPFLLGLCVAMKLANAKMERKGSSAEAARKRPKYGAGGASWETRLAIAEWAVNAKAAGVSVSSFAKNGKSTSYNPSPRTLRRHVAALEGGDSPFKDEKEAGREPALHWEQKKILCGAVLMCSEKVILATLLAKRVFSAGFHWTRAVQFFHRHFVGESKFTRKY
jgi:hypothetical protein